MCVSLSPGSRVASYRDSIATHTHFPWRSPHCQGTIGALFIVGHNFYLNLIGKDHPPVCSQLVLLCLVSVKHTGLETLSGFGSRAAAAADITYHRFPQKCPQKLARQDGRCCLHQCPSPTAQMSSTARPRGFGEISNFSRQNLPAWEGFPPA